MASKLTASLRGSPLPARPEVGGALAYPHSSPPGHRQHPGKAPRSTEIRFAYCGITLVSQPNLTWTSPFLEALICEQLTGQAMTVVGCLSSS